MIITLRSYLPRLNKITQSQSNITRSLAIENRAETTSSFIIFWVDSVVCLSVFPILSDCEFSVMLDSVSVLSFVYDSVLSSALVSVSVSSFVFDCELSSVLVSVSVLSIVSDSELSWVASSVL